MPSARLGMGFNLKRLQLKCRIKIYWPVFCFVFFTKIHQKSFENHCGINKDPILLFLLGEDVYFYVVGWGGGGAVLG